MNDQKQPLTVLFYGPSGAGKGTQARILEDYLEKNTERNVLYVETGALLRKFAKEHGFTQDITCDVMAKGGLLPSFLPVHLWGGVFINEFNGSEHVIMDGLARRAPEAPILDGALRFYERSPYHIIVFELSRDSAKERLLSRGRGDGMTDEAIKLRLDWYEENTLAAVAEFESLGAQIHRLDAEPSIEDIHKEVLSVLGLEA